MRRLWGVCTLDPQDAKRWLYGQDFAPFYGHPANVHLLAYLHKKKTNRKSRPIPEDIGLAAPKGGGQMSRGGKPHTLPELRHYYTPVCWHGRLHRLRAETESVEPPHPQSLHQHGHPPEAAAAW